MAERPERSGEGASTSIHDIQSMQTRALLRGLLNRGARRSEAGKALQKLLVGLERDDLGVFDALIRNSQLFQHLSIRPEFPAESPFEGTPAFSLVPNSRLDLDYIHHRIEVQSALVAAAFRHLAALNLAIWSGDDLQIVSAITNVSAQSGHSLVLARKLSFLLGYAPKETALYKLSTEIVSQYGLNNRNYGIIALTDSIGFEFNYLDLKFRFRDFISLDRGSSIAKKVSYLSFMPLDLRHSNYRQLIPAAYEVSLTDAAYTWLVHREMGVARDMPALPQDVEDAWVELSANAEGPLEYFDSRNFFVDTHAFRAAAAFLEYAPFRNLRGALQPLYDLPELRQDPRDALIDLTSPFYEDVRSLEDLVPTGSKSFEPLPERFDRKTAGAHARSCGIVWVCDSDPDFSKLSANSMAELMGHTTEVDRLLSTDTLRRAAQSASDPTVKLMLHTLLRAHSTSTKDNYAFKEMFQNYVRANHDGQIIDFINEAWKLNKDIVEYFINLLDETMLSQMAFLMASSDSIYETRAALLEWFADVKGEEGTRAKARQLRLDRKIAAVRGAINETRLNIDSVRFKQWIEQNKLISFSGFLRQSTLSLPTPIELAEKAKTRTIFLSSHREPSTLALQAISECYTEFCRNPDFGIASFLGRRIRHGTLRGTLMNGVPNAAEVNLPQNMLPQYQAWFSDFSASINTLASRLHFRDKTSHKNALISADIDTADKWQACLDCLNTIFTRGQEDHGAVVIPLYIEQYCWYIFELELSNVQRAIAEFRNKWGVLKLKNHLNDQDAIAVEKAINIALQNHFNTVVSWFRKPPNISPVAEFRHVVDVALQEASDEYASFAPTVAFSGEKDLELSGAVYYIVYDALTIAIRNAAKHGSCPGRLGIHAEVAPSGQGRLLSVTVASELRQGDTTTEALRRIEAAGYAGPDGADVVEGLSGIRKLKKMLAEKGILDFRLTTSTSSDGDSTVCMTIDFPLRGVLE